MILTSPPAGIRAFLATVSKHKQLFITLSVLSVVAAGSQILLRADLTGGPTPQAVSSSSASSLDARACSSERTMFRTLRKPRDITTLFSNRVSEVIEERENLLQHPSLWKCGPKDVPSIPKLRALAADLSAWNYATYPLGSLLPQVVPRTVDWQSLAPILSEYLREYECKLAELETVSSVLQPADFGFPSEESETYMQRANRAEWAARTLREQRLQARLAIERTLSALKSAEQHFQLTKDFVCLQRTTMDLQAEMTLLADTVSCLPKIWDSATSLHDRKELNYNE